MSKILAGYLFPHPPIIVEELGGKDGLRASKTIEACKELARDIRDRAPDTIVLVTPHGPLFSDAISISMEESLKGDFHNFGDRSLSFKYRNNTKLIDRIIDKAYRESIPIAEVDAEFARKYNVALKLDHGALVPLYFIENEYQDFKLIHITYGLLEPEKLYRFGKIIQELVMELDEKAILVASGDLSHKLSDEGPYNYSPYGKEFDEKITRLLEKGDFASIRSFDLELTEKAGECALRSLIIMGGFLDGLKLMPEVLSYEGPFGVGYANAKFPVEESQYVELARRSLEYYLEYGETMEVPKDLKDELLNSRKGAFVTIKKDNRLRGCIGTIAPTQDTLAREIIENAISAGTRDPRFNRVTREELPNLVYSVDVLALPETIESIEDLDVKKYGVIVTKDSRKGLLLPNLDGVDTVEEQLGIALSKANIGEKEDYTLERFQVTRYY